MTRHAASALIFVAAAGMLSACGGDEPDAYGNFEAREVIVSAEVGGRLLRFDPDEGTLLGASALVGQIDTTSLALQRQELLMQQEVTRARGAEAEAQIDVLQAQLATAVDEHDRISRLFNAQAATARQHNQAEGDVSALRERIKAARAQVQVIERELGSVQARVDQIEDEIRKSRIQNPTPGTVLATYVEPGEFVQPGQPLYKVADLGQMTLRAYVTGAQLAGLRIGEPVQVQYDLGARERGTRAGRVSWIAAEAEFTPTPIQTREERTDQVYAVKVQVTNPDGALKIGMPGELVVAPPASAEELAAADSPSRRLARWLRR